MRGILYGLLGLVVQLSLVVAVRSCDYRGMPISPPVTSVSNADGSMTCSPTTGNVICSLNQAFGATWSQPQLFSGFASVAGSFSYDLSASTGAWKTPNSALQTAAGSTTITASGDFVLSSGFRPNKGNIADVNTASTAIVIAYTSITAARNITTTCALGSTANPRMYWVKDESGSASGVNTITLVPSSGTIDGAASKVCINAAFGSCHFYSNGTNCFTW